jgi:hypothetical protein
LSPEGWKRASQLFERSDPYPKNGAIQIVSTGGLVAEIWMRGNAAEVETKWDNFYGTIDATLRYKPTPRSIMMDQRFAMVCVPQQLGDEKGKTAGTCGPGEWKISGSQRVRFATIAAAIRYAERIREQSKDRAIRENADKTIIALKRIRQGCGSASAC